MNKAKEINTDMQTNEPTRLSRKRIFAIVGIMLGILLVSAVLFYFMIMALSNKTKPDELALSTAKQYTYTEASASNGMTLHVLQTKPSNITLEAIQNNVTLTEHVGINGGFFYGDQLLSISVVNSLPVNGAIGKFGTGSENVKYARGTLVWDGAADTLSVQVVRLANELKVKDHNRFWAQGGISMSLGNDSEWYKQAALENAPFPDEDRLRSAAVYDNRGTIYLIVSETKGTLEMFRQAIIDTFSKDNLVDGIFLDGDGSSQLYSNEVSLPGDNRPVVQMLRIVK